MKLQVSKVLYLFSCLIVVGVVGSSCVSQKKVKQFVYLNDLSDSIQQEIRQVEPLIQPGDRISITISAPDPESAIPFNAPATVAGATPVATTLPGYLVNNDGTIQLPQLGKWPVSGRTRQQVADSLARVLVSKELLADPAVTVQITNFRVTVLGDVSAPGTKVIPEQKATLFDAIGLAGDLTIYGRRDNVLVIREKEGRRQFGRVNLTSTSVFNSPFYNLQQNDIIYVEMTKPKIDASDQTLVRNVSIAASLVSLLATVIILIVNISR